MPRKIEFKWEWIDSEVRRAKVKGGWIINVVLSNEKGKISESSSIFIDDKYHDWEIQPPQKDLEAVKIALAEEFKD